MKKILIVDDLNVIIEGIKTILLRENFDYEYLEANNRKDALKIITQNQIDILCVEISIPRDYMSKPLEYEGLELISEVNTLINKPRIIVVTQNDRLGLIKKLHSYNVNGILLRKQLSEEITIAVKLVSECKNYYSPALDRIGDVTETYSRINLSVFQEHILRLLAEGKTNFEISELIARSERTVERNLNELRYVFDSKTNPELVAKAFRLGFID